MQEETITRAIIVVQQGMTPSAKQVCLIINNKTFFSILFKVSLLYIMLTQFDITSMFNNKHNVKTMTHKSLYNN